MLTVHDLTGCAPVPLAHYLKALGILRIVTEQVDPQARGWWEGDRFRLATTVSKEELETFFLEMYEPTPIVAPWNGGTGFYPNDKKASKAIERIMTHPSPRFDSYRSALADARDEVGNRKKAPEKQDKEQFIANCFKKWRGQHREVLAAAIVLGGDGKPSYPSLFGTGLNDGRLDFSSNYMDRLVSVLSPPDKKEPHAAELIKESLWSLASLGMDTKGAIGQFHPGGAGGANSSNAATGNPISNPWDFIFMLEGAVLFVASATRRMGVNQSGRAAAPFTVSSQGAGYASSAGTDESARGEQWMPLWFQPIGLAELKRLLGEGRAQLGTKPAKEPLDMARAIARLGTTRGIAAFQRYGYIERNGQANLAVPLGCFRVPDRISPRLSCLDDLDTWLPRLRRDVRALNAPGKLRLAEHNLSEALFSVTQHVEIPIYWQSVLLGLASVEEAVLRSGASKCGPIPKLRPEWAQAADDGSPEIRLAVAFALQWDERPFGTVRRHWIPGKNDGTAAVMSGRNGIDDAISLVKRRLIEASREGQRRLALKPQIRASAEPSDLTRLIAGDVDIDRTVALARALMAIDIRQWLSTPAPPRKALGEDYPDDAWLTIRLAMLPHPLLDGRNIGIDPAILRRLESGDAGTAVTLALRRLRAAGISATVQCSIVPVHTARLWAAALAFPVKRSMVESFVQRLDPNIN